MSFFEIILWLKVPIALLGYTRSFYGLYVGIPLFCILCLIRGGAFPKYLVPLSLMLSGLILFTLHCQIYSYNDLPLDERVVFWFGSDVSSHSIDNMHLPKVTLGLIRQLPIFSDVLPSGDSGQAFIAAVSPYLLAILAFIQLLCVYTICRAIASYELLPERIILAAPAVATIKTLFDGGPFAASAVASTTLFCSLLYLMRNAEQSVIQVQILKAVAISIITSLIVAIIIALLLFGIDHFDYVVSDRLLTATGINGITLLLATFRIKHFILPLFGFLFSVAGLLSNPVIYDDIRFAYRRYQSGSTINIFVNKPNKHTVREVLVQATDAHELYAKYSLRPGFDWIKQEQDLCLNRSAVLTFSFRGQLQIDQTMSEKCSILKCSSNHTWCDYRGRIEMPACYPYQESFPEHILHCFRAVQPTIVRGIISDGLNNRCGR